MNEGSHGPLLYELPQGASLQRCAAAAINPELGRFMIVSTAAMWSQSG
jgi:hypothetical protein